VTFALFAFFAGGFASSAGAQRACASVSPGNAREKDDGGYAAGRPRALVRLADGRRAIALLARRRRDGDLVKVGDVLAVVTPVEELESGPRPRWPRHWSWGLGKRSVSADGGVEQPPGGDLCTGSCAGSCSGRRGCWWCGFHVVTGELVRYTLRQTRVSQLGYEPVRT
jgi:hypothetical protein